MPKHRAENFPLSERKDINIGRLVHYTTAMAEDEKTTGPVAQRHIGETQTKHRRAEQLYGEHLLRSGATMAKKNQTTTFDQSHKLSAIVQKYCENVKCSENLRSCSGPQSLSHFQNSGFIKIRQPRLKLPPTSNNAKRVKNITTHH